MSTPKVRLSELNTISKVRLVGTEQEHWSPSLLCTPGLCKCISAVPALNLLLVLQLSSVHPILLEYGWLWEPESRQGPLSPFTLPQFPSPIF